MPHHCSSPARLALRLIFAAVVFLPALRGGAAETAAAKATAASPYNDLEFLTGGIWIGTLPADASGNILRIEARFTWPENRQGIRFDSAWLSGETRTPYASGLYAWHATKGKLITVYTDSSGSLTEGIISREAGAFVHELTITDKDGKAEQVRSRLIKVNQNAFTNEIYRQQNGAWVKFVEVRYERQR